MSLQIGSSLAAAPLARLGEAVKELERAGVDYLHFDVEDGSFTPVMTLGTKLIADLRPLTSLPFDVHLMMVDPEWIVPDLVAYGADRISVHYEACPYPRRVLRKIVSSGAQAGLALNPATPLPELTYLSPYLTFVVILTTEPEVPDCPFLPGVLEKVRAGKRSRGLENVTWVVDGGITPATISQAAAAEADSVVVGRAVFLDGKITENIAALRSAAG